MSYLMINWYSNLNVQIKWYGKYSTKINIHAGTRQSGLSSPYLFNLFYQELIDLLSKCTGGIQIGENSYNVFCYADDRVLTSLSVTGLQDLVNSAKSFIVSHGLNFNPSKTVCTTFGHSVFERTPSCTLDGITLKEETSVTYLGTTMSDNPTNHIKARIPAARRAFS